MAQGNVIDAGLLYKVGKARTSPAPRDPREGWFTKQLFSWLGRESLGYFTDAWDKKKVLAAKNENSDLDWAKTIAEEKGPLKDLYQENITAWTEQRNEGQNLVAKYHGFPASKKYKEGMALVNSATMKIENLYASASERLKKKNEIKQFEATGTISDADGNAINTKYSSGTIGPEMHNNMSLANGDMDGSFQVNPETGNLELVRETRTRGFGMPHKPGLIDETTTTITPFNEIKWANYEDNTQHNMGDKYKDSGTKFGAGGVEWTESHEMGIRADINQDISEMSTPAFRSWFFGGTQYKYSDAGKNFMTPAQDFIAQKYSEVQPGTAEYEGVLNTLKLQDLSSPEYKQFAIQSMLDVNKQFHNNALLAYKEKHKPKPKRGSRDKIDKSQVMVDGRKVSRSEAMVALRNMSIKGTEYSNDQSHMYINDGEGGTIVKRRQQVLNENTGLMDTKWTKIKGITTTNQAIKFRGLDFGGGEMPYQDVEQKPSFDPNLLFYNPDKAEELIDKYS